MLNRENKEKAEVTEFKNDLQEKWTTGPIEKKENSDEPVTDGIIDKGCFMEAD